MPVVVTVDGRQFSVDDLTLDEAVEIEKVCGVTWLNINPFRSAEQCRAIISMFLRRDLGPEEAAKRVGALSVGDALDSIKSVDGDDLPDTFVDGVPKAGAEPATTG